MSTLRFIEIRGDQEKRYEKLCEKEKLFPFSNALLDILFEKYETAPSKSMLEYLSNIVNILDEKMECNALACEHCPFNYKDENGNCLYGTIITSLLVFLEKAGYKQ